MNFTAVQKTKWKKEIRTEFLMRPMLISKLKVNQGLAEKIFNDTLPEPSEIDLLDSLLKKDRAASCDSIRPLVQKIIGYRKCSEIAKKLGISDSRLRDFLKGKINNFSYNNLLKIEYYLNHITGRKISPENAELAKHFIREKLDTLQQIMDKIGKDIQFSCYYFNAIEKITLKSKLTENEKYRIEQAQSQIVNSIRRLEEVKEKFETICKAYL